MFTLNIWLCVRFFVITNLISWINNWFQLILVNAIFWTVNIFKRNWLLVSILFSLTRVGTRQIWQEIIDRIDLNIPCFVEEIAFCPVFFLSISFLCLAFTPFSIDLFTHPFIHSFMCICARVNVSNEIIIIKLLHHLLLH